MIGQTLSHFKITAKLGEGGMGEVWRAEDSKLGREVAIKVLPAAFTENVERLARFEREAKVLASLNHQNIAGIFEVGESAHGDSSIHFLVMELVEGQDLSERLGERPMSVEEAIPIALQIAEALEQAHEKGIVHRDLKPQNIKVTAGGPTGVQVKVLDFGLAKAMDPDDLISAPSSDLTHSPTMTLGATVEGMIMGTAAYMSPEQAKGQAADKRADIWAFGVVLKEMLTGRRLFDAPTAAETLAKVLTAGPEASELPPAMPPALRRLIERCLQRESRERLRDIGDARLELEAAQLEVERGETAEPAGDTPAVRAPRWGEALAWSVAAIAVVLALAGTFRDSVSAPEARSVRFSIPLEEGMRIAYIDKEILTFSADGSSVAFVALDGETARQMIFVRRLDSGEARAVTGTEGGASPVFSPDGRQLAFFVDGELKRIPIEGGRATTVAEASNPRGLAWVADGSIVFSPDYSVGLYRISAEGGEPELIIEPDLKRDERTYRWPDVSADGRIVIFTIGFNNSPNDYSGAEIAVVNLASGESKVLASRASMARFVEDDRILYGSDERLYSIEFDPDKLETIGEPRAVVEGVGGDPSSGVFYFAIASSGDLAYVPGTFAGTRSHLALVDLEGNEVRPETPGPLVSAPRISPDGRHLTFAQGRLANGIGDIWTYSLADGALNRVSFGDGEDTVPIYSPDGRWIVFLRSEEGILRVPSDGNGSAEILYASDSADLLYLPQSFSPDGETLAVMKIGGGPPSIHLLRPSGELELFEEDASSPMISPDGRWVAFSSPGSGDTTVIVRPIEGPGRWQVAPRRGGYPHWASGGRELFYIDIDQPSRPIVKVEIEPGDTLRASRPTMVLDEVAYRFVTVTAPANNWDVSADGKRLVFIALDRVSGTKDRIELVLNWAAELDAE